MAVDLRCPECGDNFGKDTENYKHVTCECGCEIYNERGYDPSEEEKEVWSAFKTDEPKPIIESDLEYEERAHKAWYAKHG